MVKYIKSGILLSLLLTLLILQSCTNSKEKNMYINNGSLYSAAHEKVILKGVNAGFGWRPNSKENWFSYFEEIAKTNANCVRIVWHTGLSAAEMDSAVNYCIKNHMIPMVELHDATGDWSKLDSISTYWYRPDIQAVVNKYQDWFLLNIVNECGTDDVPDEDFINDYSKIIQKLRLDGIKVPIVVDATGWGKNYQQIFRAWKTVFENDPLKNTLFSVHTYWAGTTEEKMGFMDEIIETVISEQIPFIIGEGPTPSAWDCEASPYEYGMEELHNAGIGWLAWSWGIIDNRDCGPNSAYDMTKDGLYGDWQTDYGRIVTVDSEFSIANTSVRPKSLTPSN